MPSQSTDHDDATANAFELAGLRPELCRELPTAAARDLAVTLLRAQVRLWHPDVGGDKDVASALSDALDKLASNETADICRRTFLRSTENFSAASEQIIEKAGSMTRAVGAVSAAYARVLTRPSQPTLDLTTLSDCTLQLVPPTRLIEYARRVTAVSTDVAKRAQEELEDKIRTLDEELLATVPAEVREQAEIELLWEERGLADDEAREVLRRGELTELERLEVRQQLLRDLRYRHGLTHPTDTTIRADPEPGPGEVEEGRITAARRAFLERFCLEQRHIDENGYVFELGVRHRIIGAVDGRGHWTVSDNEDLVAGDLSGPEVHSPPLFLPLEPEAFDPRTSETALSVLLRLQPAVRLDFPRQLFEKGRIQDPAYFVFAVSDPAAGPPSVRCLGELLSITD